MNITYFGHSAVRIDVGSSVILIDPFLSGNPHFKGDLAEATAGATHILLSHGHSDHVGDTVSIAQQTGAQVVAMVELAGWVNRRGAEKVIRANTGGTIKFDDFSVTLTQAFHSSSQTDENGNPIYLGTPNGLVLRFPDGPCIYHMGDTDVFAGMELIQELYRPKIGFVPIGDHFTMGADTAAFACRRYFSFDTIVPVHWGTMKILAPSPDAFIAAMGDKGHTVKVPEVGVPFEV